MNEPQMQGDAIAYIRELVAWTYADSRQVHIRTTAAVGLMIVFLTQLPFGRMVRLGGWRWALLAAVGLLGAATVLYLFYSHLTHVKARDVASSLTTGDTVGAFKAADSVYAGWRRVILQGADALFLVAAALLFLVLGKLLRVY